MCAGWQIRPHAARRHAEVLRPLSVATTHQARTRVEPEQHRGISSHEQVRKWQRKPCSRRLCAQMRRTMPCISTCIDLSPRAIRQLLKTRWGCLQTQQQPAEVFDWAHQWYSIGSAEDMDPSRPHAITLLGRDLVLWRDQQGDWRAFEDMCPHRLAPLSGAAWSAATTQPLCTVVWCRCAGMSTETIGLRLPICRQQHGRAHETWCHLYTPRSTASQTWNVLRCRGTT